MSNPTDVFKKRKYNCLGEEPHIFEALQWASQPLPDCPECGSTTELFYESRGAAPGVIGDEIDIEVRHGLCHDDGTPRRFRSMSDLRKAAAQKGLTIMGETPKVYEEYSRGRG